MRSILLFLTLGFSLGCMGAVNSLTGLDIAIELGEDAVHPADFPAAAPIGGTPLMSMGMTADAEGLNLPDGVDLDVPGDQKYRMELITYEVPVADAAGLMEVAKAQVVAAGYAESVDEGQSVVFKKGDSLFVVVDQQDPDQGLLSLLRLVPVIEP